MQYNLLALTGFKLTIGGTNEFKLSEFFAVSASFPSISLGEANASFRNRQGFVPDDVLQYEPLTIRIAVDEELQSYNEIYNWMLHNTNEFKLKTQELILHFMTGHNNVSRQVKFTDAFPTSCSGIEFNVQNTATDYAYVDVTFRYDRFEFIDI
jgi:hypothetical protein